MQPYSRLLAPTGNHAKAREALLVFEFIANGKLLIFHLAVYT